MWHRLCSLAELAEDTLTRFEVGGVAVIATLVGGECRACPPRCPHMAEPLDLSGFCEEGILTCSKHLWQWDLRNGEAMSSAERPLHLYPTRHDGAEVWIEIERELTYDE